MQGGHVKREPLGKGEEEGCTAQRRGWKAIEKIGSRMAR